MNVGNAPEEKEQFPWLLLLVAALVLILVLLTPSNTKPGELKGQPGTQAAQHMKVGQ